MDSKWWKFGLVLLMLAALCAVPACTPRERTRPYGYMTLGALKDFTKSEYFFPEKRLLLRRDDAGFYIMSTSCTYDLTALVPVKRDEGPRRWLSQYTKSSYSDTGEILTGPATKGLPYYRLKLDSLEFGGPKNGLYVHVGEEVPANWRLPVPPQVEPANQDKSRLWRSDWVIASSQVGSFTG